jgi:predicted helicase
MTKKAEIYYFTLNDEMPRTEKLAWFKNTAFKRIDFDRIIPDKTNNWLNQTDNDFESLMPLIDYKVIYQINLSLQCLVMEYLQIEMNGFMIKIIAI